MSCFTKLVTDLTVDCDNIPVAGLEVNVLLINREDIDYVSTTFDGTFKSLITSLELKTGSNKGILLEGVKQINFADSEVVVSEDTFNKFKHGFAGRMIHLTKEVRSDIDNMVNYPYGFVAVVEKIWKGAASVSAFVVLGWQNGLHISEGKEATNELDGVFNFKLSSRDNALEPKNPFIVLETDYATTLTAFNTGFVSAP